jgi:hypothetical protein
MKAKPVSGKEIQRVLGGVSTTLCHYCGDPCRVPEDVVAVIRNADGSLKPFAVCNNLGCDLKLAEDMRDAGWPDG